MERRISSPNRPILCAVLDAAAFGPEPRSFATRLFDAGVDWIQLRDRALDGRPLYELACQLVAAARSGDVHPATGEANPASTSLGSRPVQARSAIEVSPAPSPRRILINRRLDIALASGADGVHLGFDAVDAASARLLLGVGAWIGASFHSPAEVEAAARVERSPLSYIHLAPIWNPNSKPASRPPLGEETLADCSRRGIPILAQGGLDEENAGRAIAAGARGIAVTGQLARGPDPIAQAVRLRNALDRTGGPSGRSGPSGTEIRNRSRRAGDTESAQ